MGYIRHNAIVVTGAGYARELLEEARACAKELFGGLVTEIVKSETNQYASFFIAPDGSKEGWDMSDGYNEKRQTLCDFIDLLAYEDGSNPISFVDVGYDEEHKAAVDRTNVPIKQEA